VGVFAARSIEVGEPLTYDYRYCTLYRCFFLNWLLMCSVLLCLDFCLSIFSSVLFDIKNGPLTKNDSSACQCRWVCLDGYESL